MNNKDGFFKETGVLNENGKSLLLGFTGALEMLFGDDEVSDMTIAELRMLGTNMLTMVSDMIANRIAFKQQVSNKFDGMSDEEFDDYLKEKYGDVWQLITLQPDELARVPVLSQEKIKELLEEGAKSITPWRGGGLILDPPKRRYKK